MRLMWNRTNCLTKLSIGAIPRLVSGATSLLTVLIVTGFLFQFAGTQQIQAAPAQRGTKALALGTVTVTPARVTLAQSQTQAFTAAVTNTNTAVTWSINPAVGSISAAGLYTAPASILGSQTVTVKATSVANSTKSATATVTLNPPVSSPVSVTVTPGSVALTQSQTQAFTATVANTSNAAVTWSINPAVGSISAAGLYTAPASISSSQTVTVQATSVADATKSAIATVTLNPPVSSPVSVTMTPASVTLTPSQIQAFTATVSNTSNTAVTWSISPAVGSISTSGLYTAPPSILSSQTVTVKATSAADATKSATSIVTVSPPVSSPVSVTVTPASVTLTQSQTQAFTATVANTTNTAVTWSISPAVGSISATGLYTAPASILGSQTITVRATSVANSTKSATATVTLNPPVSVTVTPASATMTQSQAQMFTATVTNTSNTAVTWSISPQVGSISTAGLYIAPATISSSQTVTVTATSVADATKSATAAVTLNPPVSVTVTPANVTLTQSQTQAFTATVTNTSNTAVTWSVSPAVGSITAAGLYTAPAAIASSQTVTVTATSVADTTKSATATVTLNPPAGVTVTPASVTLTQSQTQAFSATVTNSSNTAVTWSISPVVGSITAAGLYTAPATIASSQTVTVKATSVADSTKSATVTVTLNPPVGVTVTPASATLTQSQTQTFTATVTNTSNTAVTWSISPVVGAISTAGLYTAPASISTSQTVTVTATSVADATKSATATVTLNPPVGVSVTPTAATMLPSQGQTFTATVTGTSSTGVTWSIAPATGAISSAGLYTAPSTVASTSSVTVTATSVANPARSASAGVTLIPPVQITTTSLPGGTVGTAYTASLAATGGVAPYTWSVASGSLPGGLSLSASTGTISGTPTAAGSYNVTVKVTDAAGYQATAALAIVIAAASCTTCSPLGITTTSLPAGTVGSAYSATLAATGGTSPYTWSISAGQLPFGLTLASATGAISGTSSSVGSSSFTAMVTDSASPHNTASQALTINVTAAPATDQYGGLMTLTSPSGISGRWGVEKYPTADGNGRWLFTTPAGHGLWCGSQYGPGLPSSLNVTAKYGSRLNWEKAALDRYTGWGFNCIAEEQDIGLMSDMNASLLNERVPYFSGDSFVYDAVGRRSMVGGQILPTDAVKDLDQAAGYYTGWNATMADGFDPNFATYVLNFAAARMSPGNLIYDPYAQVTQNAYNMGVTIGDADYTYGFGPGPDDCVTPDATYHPHLGWMALASPLNFYAQWQDAGNPYDGLNWIFTNPEVYAKNNLVSYLQTKYTTVAALNAAWGSNYTAFNTAATRYSGEVVGTTNSTVTGLSHTLAHSGVSPESLVIKVDGVPMMTDPGRALGTIVGRWPDGATAISGTINYSNGHLVISSTARNQLNIQGAGSTSWGTINLGNANVVPGSIVLRLEGSSGTSAPDCRISDDNGAGNGWGNDGNCVPQGPFTVTGTINYSAGTITSFTISPAISSSYWVQFQYQWTSALPGAHTVTVDYDVNGFAVGTTLADENGSHAAWLGTTDGMLAKPGNAAGLPAANANVWADLSGWLYNYVGAYYTSTVDTLRSSSYYPGKLFFGAVSGIGGHMGCPRKQVAQATAAHADFMTFSQVTQPLLNMLVTWGLGDKPIVDAWEGYTAQADSPFSGNPITGSTNYATQQLRGAAMAAGINADLTARGVGGTSYQNMGIQFWSYSDTSSENANFGLVSALG